MLKIQQNTIYLENHTRLFTTQVMREYLNLFITFFREYSLNDGGKILIGKLGSFHLEHFYALIRRYCYFDSHLMSIAHSIERIIALRLIKESDEMKWFNDVHRRKLKEFIDTKNNKLDWEIASKIFILADDIFEAMMFIDSPDYELPFYILDKIYKILTGKNKWNFSDNSSKINDLHISLYSISDKSFQNKGSNAKARLMLGSTGIFQKKED